MTDNDFNVQILAVTRRMAATLLLSSKRDALVQLAARAYAKLLPLASRQAHSRVQMAVLWLCAVLRYTLEQVVDIKLESKDDPDVIAEQKKLLSVFTDSEPSLEAAIRVLALQVGDKTALTDSEVFDALAIDNENNKDPIGLAIAIVPMNAPEAEIHSVYTVYVASKGGTKSVSKNTDIMTPHAPFFTKEEPFVPGWVSNKLFDQLTEQDCAPNARAALDAVRTWEAMPQATQEDFMETFYTYIRAHCVEDFSASFLELPKKERESFALHLVRVANQYNRDVRDVIEKSFPSATMSNYSFFPSSSHLCGIYAEYARFATDEENEQIENRERAARDQLNNMSTTKKQTSLLILREALRAILLPRYFEQYEALADNDKLTLITEMHRMHREEGTSPGVFALRYATTMYGEEAINPDAKAAIHAIERDPAERDAILRLTNLVYDSMSKEQRDMMYNKIISMLLTDDPTSDVIRRMPPEAVCKGYIRKQLMEKAKEEKKEEKEIDANKKKETRVEYVESLADRAYRNAITDKLTPRELYERVMGTDPKAHAPGTKKSVVLAGGPERLVFVSFDVPNKQVPKVVVRERDGDGWRSVGIFHNVEVLGHVTYDAAGSYTTAPLRVTFSVDEPFIIEHVAY